MKLCLNHRRGSLEKVERIPRYDNMYIVNYVMISGGFISYESPTVESDFSIINCEKNSRRSALTYLSLEGILHSKQFDMVKNLKKGKNKDSDTVHNDYNTA